MDHDGEDEVLDAGNAELVPFTGAAGRGMRLNDLPDDVLALILSHLGCTIAAAKLSVVSTRWRDLWYRIPSLTFLCLHPSDSSSVTAALASRGAAEIHDLVVRSVCGATPEAAASWLRLAGPLVTRELIFHSRFLVLEETLDQELHQEVVVERGTFELPCFKKATKIWLNLGFLGLSLPPVGIFAALKVLKLECVQFHGECTLEDTMWPFLEVLNVHYSRGFTSLTIKLNSLIWMQLCGLQGLQQLQVVTPELKKLTVTHCFTLQLPSASYIVAEGLENLLWIDNYDPGFIQFSKMPRLQLVSPNIVYPYGWLQPYFNPSCQRLLRLFPSIHRLAVWIEIQPDVGSTQPLMEGITKLPDVDILSLNLTTERHAYGASVLHFLTMCTGIRKLELIIQAHFEREETCSPNCICHQSPSDRAQNVQLTFLEEVQISNFRGKEHEVDFVKLLLKAASTLRRIGIICHSSIAGRQELSEVLQSCASQETSVEVTFPLLP